jgi:DNA/RNA-binding domain of Phe-tRNA-synthetase-like protein
MDTSAERMEGGEPSPQPGRVAPQVRAEFPGLSISHIEVEGGRRRSPEPVLALLRQLSDRFYGSHAVHLRERPIPWAYRVFFRQIGLDPDETRTPVETLALQRLEGGAFQSRGLPDDALTIATVETGVALQALDAGSLTGDLSLRTSAPGESLAGRVARLTAGTLVIADEQGPLAVLFGPLAEGCAVGRGTERTILVAVQVDGVPDIAVEEALWLAARSIGAA